MVILKTTDLTNLWNQIYLDVDKSLEKYSYEGATGTTVLLWRSPDGKRYLQSANVGDSTAFLCRNGEAIYLSEDHKPTSVNERKRLDSIGVKLNSGQTRLNGLAVSRAFGDFFPKEVNCGIICEPYISDLIEVGPKDTKLIVASDGLWDIMSGQHAFDLIDNISDPQVAAKKLVHTAVQSTKCTDNVTVIVIHLQKA